MKILVGIWIEKTLSWKIHIDNTLLKIEVVCFSTYLVKFLYLPNVSLALFILWFDSLGTGIKDTFNKNLIASEKSSPNHVLCQ